MLLAVGLSPVTANVSNTIGLVPGSFSGAWGYRRELAGQRDRVVRLGFAALVGGVLGAVALLVLPAGAFEAIVPAFIALALVLIVLQPRISRRLAAGRPAAVDDAGDEVDPREGTGTRAGMVVAGIYGGYFGAAQGILQLALLGLAFPREALQRLNAVKNVTAGGVNLVAGIVFIVVADVDWLVVGLIAVGSTLGGSLSGRYGRRIPPGVLRALIVVVGLVAMVELLT